MHVHRCFRKCCDVIRLVCTTAALLQQVQNSRLVLATHSVMSTHSTRTNETTPIWS